MIAVNRAFVVTLIAALSVLASADHTLMADDDGQAVVPKHQARPPVVAPRPANEQLQTPSLRATDRPKPPRPAVRHRAATGVRDGDVRNRTDRIVRLQQRQTMVVTLRHAPAEQVTGILERWIQLRRSESDQTPPIVATSEITNQLLVRGTKEQVNEIAELVKQLDVPVPQVRVQGLLVELRLPESADADSDPGLAKVSDQDLAAVVASLEERGELRHLGKFELMTQAGTAGFVQQGAREPRIVGTSSNSRGLTNSVSLENVGTVLAITARVTSANRVTMELDLEHSHIGPVEEGVPIAVTGDGETIRTPRIITVQQQTTVSLTAGKSVLISDMTYLAGDRRGQIFLLLRPEIVSVPE
jgi:type II secretory pathway component GspD/PulD (secretin)